MSSPAVTLSGKIRDISGNAIAGTVTAILGNYGINPPLISGDSELAPISVSTVANGSGVWSLTLWGSDQISPTNTTYTITITPASSNAATWIAEYLIKTGSYDLSNLIPLIVTPAIYIQPVAGPQGPPGAGSLLTVTPESSNFNPVPGKFFRVTTGSSTITATLPLASGISGQEFEIKKIDSGSGTVQISGTVDGVSGYSLVNQMQYVRLMSNGTDFDITGNN